MAELWIDPTVIGREEELNNGGVEPYRLRAIFSEEVWNLIVGLNIPIQWSCEDPKAPPIAREPYSSFEIDHAHHSWLSDGYVELGYRIDLKKGGKSFSIEQGGGRRKFEGTKNPVR